MPGAEITIDDPQLFELFSAVLQATVNTYPEADLVTIGMPEWRQWTRVYEDAWRTLDAKFGISKIRSLSEVLRAAEHRKWRRGPSGAEKALDEAKGDLASLVFYDRLLRSPDVLKDSRRPDMKFMYEGIAEELWPLVGRILPPGSEAGVMPDNFQTHLVERREIFEAFPSREVPGVLNLTLDDDNIGLVPQLTTKPVHELVNGLRRYGWAGFVARERFPDDHDWPIAYLARAAWDAEATPDAVAHNQLRDVCGEGCADDMLEAFHQVETVTIGFEGSNYGFSFPVPKMLMKYWKAGPMPAYLAEARSGYQRALEAVGRARAKARPTGRSYVDFWVGRLEFALGYVESVEAVHRAATAEASQNRREALREAEKALASLRGVLEAYARVARTRTDLGAIAAVNEYGYRRLKEKVAELAK